MVAATTAWTAAAFGNPDAAHDEGTLRTVGLAWTGCWQWLDAPLAAAWTALPISTRYCRAALASALIAGLASSIAFLLTRRLLVTCADLSRLGPVVSALATLTATLGISWQVEASSAGGASLGVLLALLPLALQTETVWPLSRTLPLRALTVGFAFSYEPLVGAVALASFATQWRGPWRQALSRRRQLLAVGACIVGLSPLVLSVLRYRAPLALTTAPLARIWTPLTSPLPWLLNEAGLVVLGLSAVGTVLALVTSRARPLALGLLAVAVVGIGGSSFGGPCGPDRFGAPLLAGLAALYALAAVALQALVRAVRFARIPFARTSAALVVILLLTFPVRSLDETLARAVDRGREAGTVWDETAWGAVPFHAIVLVNEPQVIVRALAARASGTLRPDLGLFPSFDLNGPLARAELEREPALVPLWRDLALGAKPNEWSLSTLAAARPLLVTFDPRWDRPLARHLVPVGLFSRFEPEPRGPSDRRRALEALVPQRRRLAHALTSVPEPTLLALTTRLLRLRALAMAATGDREVLAPALEELLTFAPSDPLAAELARRMADRKQLELQDLTP
ncbi:MAG: hypothetical protein WCI05_02555 [Myxococcales bacterium]